MLQVKYDELAAKKGEVVGANAKGAKQTRVTEKIPGFDGNASGKEETKDDIPLSVEERRAPLKEKSENVLSSESIAAKLEGSCDQPNGITVNTHTPLFSTPVGDDSTLHVSNAFSSRPSSAAGTMDVEHVEHPSFIVGYGIALNVSG
ncbi:hypothetical protein SK128_001457 [Halocaridina rubra]|uniref:Uncharacterized protein n=1 Tax=Halocaridina rubra TaxID=373956 RepID=A0AAN9A115_HALRR